MHDDRPQIFTIGIIFSAVVCFIGAWAYTSNLENAHRNVLVKHNLMAVTNDFSGKPTYFYTTNYVK